MEVMRQERVSGVKLGTLTPRPGGFHCGWGLGSCLDWQGHHFSNWLHLEDSLRGGTRFSSITCVIIVTILRTIFPL